MRAFLFRGFVLLAFASTDLHAQSTNAPPNGPSSSHVTSPSATSSSCADGAPSIADLWALVGDEAREKFSESTPRVLRAELDGPPPSETVLAVDRIAEDSADSGGEGALWVFRCAADVWSVAARTSFSIDAGWNGTIDGTPGFQNVRVERLLADRDLLRVEWLDMRGGFDPRFLVRSFDLYALRGAALERVFACPTESLSQQGPDRAGRATRRVIRFVPGSRPARIRVTMHSAWEAGAGDSSPDDGLPEEETRRAEYRYDGNRFVASRAICGESAR